MTKLLCALALLAFATPVVMAKSDPIWFVFLVRGSVKPDADKVEAMQAAHIGNFKRLFGEHKLLAAGPLQDPTEFRRGIVILRVSGAEAVRQCFNADPYVQAGVMHLEIYRWDADAKHINVKAIDPNAIEENRIVLLLAPEKADVNAKWPRIAKNCKGRIGGPLHGPGEIKEVRLFRGKEGETKIRTEMDRDAAIKAHKARYEVMPLWMAKGTLSN